MICCGQYRWQNQGVWKLTKKSPAIKASYFQLETPTGALADFIKHTVQLLDQTSVPHSFNTWRRECCCGVCPWEGNMQTRILFSSNMPFCSQKPWKQVQGVQSEITKLPAASHIPVLQPQNSKKGDNIGFSNYIPGTHMMSCSYVQLTCNGRWLARLCT